MRIMFVIPSMNNGGSERVVANLSNCFCRNNDVRIVTITSDKSYYDLDERIDFRGQALKINRKNIFTTFGCYAKNFFQAKKYIKTNIEEFRPDCIISFLAEADFLVYLAAKGEKNIVKVFSERADPTKRNKVRQLMARKAYTIGDLFVCQSRKISEYYDYIAKSKKVVIPNPLDVQILPAVAPEKNHNIVSVGRLSKQKNFALLIKSFAAVLDKLPEDCNLVIYGDGPLKAELSNLIEASGMKRRIKLAGASKNVLNEINGSALFVLSSNFEGFPNVVLEAMAMGLPVISTDFYTGVAKELIKKENGIVVPVCDEQKLSNAIVEIMQNKDLRVEMRKKNVLVRDRYSVEKISDLWLKNIAEIVERKNER